MSTNDISSSNQLSNRRRFLKTGAAAVLAASATGTSGSAFAGTLTEKKPWFKISLAQWSLNRAFFGRSEKKLDNLEFAKVARDMEIDAIEYVNQFFKDKATDTKYLDEMNKRAKDQGVKNLFDHVPMVKATWAIPKRMLGQKLSGIITSGSMRRSTWVATQFVSMHPAAALMKSRLNLLPTDSQNFQNTRRLKV